MFRFPPLRTIAAKIPKYLGGTIFALSVYHCITEYVVDIAVCSGCSMEPTLYENDIIMVQKIILDPTVIKRGDILVLRNPTNPNVFWCKRLIGLPGDRISRKTYSDVIPLGYVWLEGDNCSQSYDSRALGPLPRGLVQGKAFCTLWPSIRLLENKLMQH